MLGDTPSKTEHALEPGNCGYRAVLTDVSVPRPGLNGGPSDEQLSRLGYGRLSTLLK